MINGVRYGMHIDYVENARIAPATINNIQSTLKKYYNFDLPADLDLTRNEAQDQIFDAIRAKKMPVGKSAMNWLRMSISQSMVGDHWRFTFNSGEHGERLLGQRSDAQLLIKNGAFVVTVREMNTRQKYTHGCWILPQDDGFLFFHGKYITPRKVCRLLSEWSKIPYKANVPYDFSKHTLEFKRDAVHLLAPNAEKIEHVTIRLN